MAERIRLGVSRCLLGEPVRYDGGHARDRYLTDTLSEYVEFVPVCPEVECGFPTPRETFRLVGDASGPRFVTGKTGQDFTDRMTQWALQRVCVCRWMRAGNARQRLRARKLRQDAAT